MNRRQVLKQLALTGTIAMLVPSCIADGKKISVALNNLNITADDEELLSAMAETIIPETDEPGAKGVAAHLFTLVMIDDCADKETKEKFLKGLRSFNDECKKISGKNFMRSSPSERLSLLQSIEKNEETLPEDVRTFYSNAKSYIVQGYTSSQYFLTKVKPYALIPGPDFKGCVPVTSNQA